MKHRKKDKKERKRPPVILIFGEDQNDTESLAWLTHALRNDLPRPQPRRKPQVLVRGREEAKARKNAIGIAEFIKAERCARDVLFVIAHEDCDNVEPAHEVLSSRIERLLSEEGVNAIAATPAWELEAWWFLWPEAVRSVNRKWRDPSRSGSNVGLIQHAKEELRRALRPQRSTTRDYRESDSREIAKMVYELGLVDARDATSDSFARFSESIRSWGRS